MSHHKEILTKLLKQVAIEQSLENYSFTIKPISSGGANYTSKLFLIEVTSKNEDDLHLFAKIAAIGDKMRSDVPIPIFEIERKVYTELAKVYKHLEDKNNVPDEHRLKMPIFYGCNPILKEETILLEDLTAQGYGDYNRFKSVDWEYASKAIEELAKWHALSFAFRHEYPEKFENFLKEITFDWNADEDKKVFFENILLAGVAATKEENRDRVKEFLGKFDMADNFKGYFLSNYTCALVHRDYRASNLMHKINEDGKIDIRVIDYQTLQGGSPVVDLFYFIFTGSDEEFRKKHYEQLLDHYYTHLSLSMQRLGLNAEAIYSKEVFKMELEEKLPLSLVIAMFTLPIVTVEAKNAPRLDGELGVKSFKVENASELFPERLNGIVNDFIRWKLL